MSLWPVDDVDRVFRAVADFNRESREARTATPPPKRSMLPPKKRAERIERNKAARKARRKNRSK